MARLPQLNLPDIPQHVVQRGNNKQAYFFNDDDFEVYLDKLKLCGKSLIRTPLIDPLIRYVARNHSPVTIDDNISDIFSSLSIK